MKKTRQKTQKPPAPRSAMGTFRLALWGVVVLAGLGSSWLFLRPQAAYGPVRGGVDQQETNATLGQGNYRLVTGDGQLFTAESLVGQPSLVFFGFATCPDVCPTTLSDIALWQEELGPLADNLRVFVITVDPERDTPEVMAAYVGWLENAQGVSGAPEEVAKALASFRIYASRIPLEGGDYTINHSSYVMQFGADGRYRQIFGYQQPYEQVVLRLRGALEE